MPGTGNPLQELKEQTQRLHEPHEESPGLRSYFDRQVRSDKQTYPSFGFGSSTRDGASKVFLSREASRATPGNVSQGPVYTVPDSIGKQADSRKSNSSAFGFGTASRPGATNKNQKGDPGPGAYKAPPSVAIQHDSRKKNSESAVFGTGTRAQTSKMAIESKEREKALYGNSSPPPNIYKLRGSIGTQNLSTKGNLPNTKIGTASRFARGENDETPGAGTYKMPDSVGSQIQSRKKNAASIGFGTSTRDNCAKVFISHEHGKASPNGVSPGPTTANLYNGTGKQNLSNKKTAPATGFGTSKRPDITGIKGGMRTPGPGSYWI